MTPSREVDAIIRYVELRGIPHRVTSTVRPNDAGSFHAAKGTDGMGLAVDFAGVTSGVTMATARQMGAIYRAFLDVAGQLAELIYSGWDVDSRPVTVAVKNGRRVNGASFYGPVEWARHYNHVHVAVPRGVFLSAVTPSRYLATDREEPMPDNPDLPNLPDIKFFVPIVNATTGECRGYYIVSADGQLHAFGPGAPYYGRSEVPS